MKNENKKIKDIEECKQKIKALLKEYNCRLTDGDECTYVLLTDKDTNETINVVL